MPEVVVAAFRELGGLSEDRRKAAVPGVLRAVTQAFKLTYPAKAEALLLIECDVAGPSGPLPLVPMARAAEGEGAGDGGLLLPITDN